MDTIKVAHGTTRMVAHRGVSKLEKENTQHAFVAAGNRSYWGVETDVGPTADGHFVILHDETTARVAGGEGVRPEDCTLEELRQIVLLDMDGVTPNPCLRLPTLEEYVRICKKYDKECVLELKRPMSEETIKCLIDCIRAEGYLERVTFISFYFEDLVHVRKFLPNQKVQFLFGKCTDEIFENVKAHRMDVDIYYKDLTQELLQRFHDAGMEVNCWTVDDPSDAERLIGWGVDYITSNILE